MSGIISQSFRFNLRVLKAFYLYPEPEQTFLHKIRTYVLYVLFVVTVPVISIIHLLTAEDLNVEKANYNGSFLAQATSFITKFLPFVVNGQNIRKCINYFENFKVERENHQVIIYECIRICRRNTSAFYICAVGAVGSWATKPLFWKGRNFPVDVWWPFDPTTDFSTYCCVYLFVAAGPVLAALATGVIDPLIAGLCYHATSQMKILKDNLRHLSDYADEEISRGNIDRSLVKSSKQKIISTMIKKCVDHHETILKFVQEYEVCFSWVVFSQIAGSVFVVCFCCLQMSKVEALGYYVFQLAVYFSVILVQIYFYCYYGSTISEECDSLTDAIYMAEWYNYDVKIQKSLLILMERSTKPVVVTAGKTVDLSLLTFTTILRRSYSLLAVLKNYQ
ncbi:hypothetical protein Zmor_026646 [Zophobas morio]|uniref:Odorant receptor n=1 Tax=Zophobas morio TaxID=2755281 RepID=A0AA38HVT5_9CUCU|nr:hypothetical protein Zmor_026646 [Zophobas morio]